jgi:hypothetical protein
MGEITLVDIGVEAVADGVLDKKSLEELFDAADIDHAVHKRVKLSVEAASKLMQQAHHLPESTTPSMEGGE